MGNQKKKQRNPGRKHRPRQEPKKADRLRRRMLVPSARGIVPRTVTGSRQASLLGKYLAAVGNFLRTGKAGALNKFKGKQVAGQVLITDVATLRLLAQAGALQLEDIYAAPEAAP